jgi:hypothetical protein
VNRVTNAPEKVNTQVKARLSLGGPTPVAQSSLPRDTPLATQTQALRPGFKTHMQTNLPLSGSTHQQSIFSPNAPVVRQPLVPEHFSRSRSMSPRREKLAKASSATAGSSLGATSSSFKIERTGHVSVANRMTMSIGAKLTMKSEKVGTTERDKKVEILEAETKR